MSKFLVLLFFIFQTPLLQATDCKGISQEKSQEATQALLEEMVHFEPTYLNKIKCLIEAGADVNAKGAKGEFGAGDTALMHASQGKGHKEIVEMLINAGADVNVRDKFGGTALMIASQNGHVETVEMLIEKGADVNARDFLGNTALVYATEEGHKEIIKILEEAQ